jgi:hypothetical protein
MTLYQSTFRRFASPACTVKAVGQPYNWLPPSQLQHAEHYLPMFCFSAHYETLGIRRDFTFKIQQTLMRKMTID